MTFADQWQSVVDLALALVLCGIVGLEREWRQKAAGLRTHTLVGVGAALFMVVSKYGFFDVLSNEVVLDPSRIAAQIVSGIGFIGGGLIFVRRDMVRGLTTAATVWVSAGIGMAAGSRLYLVAIAVTVMYLVIVLGLGSLSKLLPRSRFAFSVLRVTYEDGRGLLRTIVQMCTAKGYFVADLELVRDTKSLRTNRDEHKMATAEHDEAAAGERPRVVVLIELEGRQNPSDLVQQLASLAGVHEVSIAEGPGGE
jgi:putative Mg2+ transporter-C (MgtC) family protein